jgi:hypothetical protein
MGRRIVLASLWCALAAASPGSRGAAQESAPADTPRTDVAQTLPSETPTPEVVRKLYLESESGSAV